jgi:hypothetical protein
METKDNVNAENLPEKGAKPTDAANEEQAVDNQESINETEAAEEPVADEVPYDAVAAGDEKEKTETKKGKTAIEKEDYSIYDRTVLLTKLNELVNNYEVEVCKEAVEEIRSVFYKKYLAEQAEARKAFEESGGKPEDFKFYDEASDETFKEVYNQFREKKLELNKKLEFKKEDNLKIKYQIIEEIKDLINKEESINKTFQEFRDLQQRWHDAGQVPQNRLKNLWESYNLAVEQFYDYIKINNELRDLDLKKNLEAKVLLCEKAEALLEEKSAVKAFKTLQDLHHSWRETGPAPREESEAIWDRFKAATAIINKKHQAFYEGQIEQQDNNLKQKLVLCEQIEQLAVAQIDSHKEWETKTKEIIEIQKIWRTIGYAPRKDNGKINQRYRLACDQFFDRKREFYKDTQSMLKNNLVVKNELCEQAEAMKDSTDWKKSTKDFILLQKRWKESGPIPKKQSAALWKRFRTACDYFFEKRAEFFNTSDKRQEDNLKQKLELIESVKHFKKLATNQESMQALMELQKQWSSIGHVPLNKKDEVLKNFRDAFNEQVNALNLETTELEKLNFQNRVENWVSDNARGKIYSERNKLITRIKELENEIALYENNIGFFSKSSSSDALLGEVNRKIEKAKERMEVLKEKLILLDTLDQE